ncbi:phosphatidic acid phosphatase type 2/haloperoxidase [Cantharellus anzutake]|uniref:phosphatidic acid phosphatase type 2/haloperoxidase n=1 Tax=Cantharellus anzutake TaxID=1750568 RepID=UPI0019030B5E|nr:phosphatidic acid phosphatase type 2/haloperoxidase [Cantharellus anzutake]KAF8326049.1 phosphatidic acid phosphatase type 2/haloperoxidase [Cantharellus anzutake]
MFGRQSANGGGRGPQFPSIPRRRMELTRSYAPDWILVIVITGCFYFLDSIHGYWREFSLTEPSIQHTFTEKERVPNWMLGVLALVLPAVLMPVINAMTIRSWWDWHNSWLGLLLSLSLTAVLTQTVKVTVGRPRPDLIARCQPKQGSQDTSPYGLVTASICTQTDMSKLKDGFRSFWSGHSSLSFAGLGFLSWYLAGKLRVFDRKGHTFKSFLAIAPLTGAMLVAISRTMDYRHHWHDVLVGSTVGLLLSFFAYHQYYPSLASSYSHSPFSPRIYPDELRIHRHAPSSVPLIGGYMDHTPDVEGGSGYDHEREGPVPPVTVPRDAGSEPVPLHHIGQQ